MEKKEINETKGLKARGITLIALVVTIVVLLILASVSIIVVFGDNGLLKLAKEAGEKTNEAVKNDISNMGELEDLLHETQTGIVVEKVTDAKPGELEEDETETNTYIINSIEDLVVFADNVTSGTDNYEGKTVKLGLSLDFASTKSYVDANRKDYGEYGYNGELKKLLNESGFIPIGTQERVTEGEKFLKNTFHGTFDGNKNAIYNLRMSKTVQDAHENGNIGMFAINNGIIQDLNIENANIYIDVNIESNHEWICLGILVGANQLERKIDRCHVSGKIGGVLNECDVGGIVGATLGEISNSYSEVDMTIIGKGNDIYEGLIVGSCSGGTIKNVYSKGTMHPQKNGIVGGVLGNCNPSAEVKKAYTVSKIKAEYNDETGYLALGAFCQCDEGKRVSNCYYLENNIEIIGEGNPVAEIGESKTEEYMKGEEFVALLNNGQEGSPWKQDTNNINDGYPILSWQQ